jgi:hypothetical protein
MKPVGLYLLHVCGMDIQYNVVAQNHYQLKGLSIHMLLTIQERTYHVAKFFFICLVNGKLILTGPHFTDVVFTLAFPFPNQVYLAGVTTWSSITPPMIATRRNRSI